MHQCNFKDVILTGVTTQVQSGPGNNNHKVVNYSPKISIIRPSPSGAI